MALGASCGDVLRATFADGLRLALPGLAVGVLLAIGIAAAMQSMLFGVSPVDPVSFGAAAGVLFLVILLASFVPALRASRIHPVEALRGE